MSKTILEKRNIGNLVGFPVLRLLFSALLLFSAFQFPSSNLQAAPIAYSGKIAVNGENFDGPGRFRFALVDHNGSTLWSNDLDGGSVTVQVNRGHYSILLGDDTTPHMAAIPSNLFLDHPVVFLRVHFSQGNEKPFDHLQPDQRILSAAHALTADVAKVADVADAVKPRAITREMLSLGLLADLNRSVVITRDMLPGDVLADLNRSIVITRDMLPGDVLDGSNDYMEILDANVSAANIFAVAKMNQNSASVAAILTKQGKLCIRRQNQTEALQFQSPETNGDDFSHPDGLHLVDGQATSSFPYDQLHVIAVGKGSSGSFLGDYSMLTVGKDTYGSGRHWKGEIAEILIYNRALSTAEIDRIQHYLGQKWGVTISSE